MFQVRRCVPSCFSKHPVAAETYGVLYCSVLEYFGCLLSSLGKADSNFSDLGSAKKATLNEF